MNQKRPLLLLGSLAIVLGIRWWDPLAKRTGATEVAEPVSRAPADTAPPTRTVEAEGAQAWAVWPVRKLSQQKDDGNAFLVRSEVLAKVAKPPPPPPPPAPYVAPPPPPPPPEPPPPLQVIGTWGMGDGAGVFITGPQGTLLAREGDTLLAEYRVQRITSQQVTLVQNSNQRIWNISIPPAPTTLQTWPGR